MEKYYTYLYLREDGTPYYVGKGTGHRAYARHRVGVPKDRERILIQFHVSEEAALAAEIVLIQLYGREDLGTGKLLNLTPGGDRPPSLKGRKKSKAAIEKWVKSRREKRGWAHSAETRQKISASHIGKVSHRKGGRIPAEQKIKISRTLKENGIGFIPGCTPWNKGKKYSISTKGKPWSEKRRAAYAGNIS